MTKLSTVLTPALLAMLALAFAGSAVAGDGKGRSCDGNKKGDSAAVVVPARPQA